MATSRTGTAKYKRWRTAILARDKAAGITHCPLCGCVLDYSRGLLPNSAEPDHIIADAFGGQLTMENGRAICRHCNQARGDGRSTARAKQISEPQVVTVDVEW